MKLYFLISGRFGEKVVGNLVNIPNFCRVCGTSCDYCRIRYGSFSSDIAGVNMIPSDVPSFIDDPENYLPKQAPKADIIVAIGIQIDILTAIPRLVQKVGAKGIVVPIEDVGWCSQKIQRNIEKELIDMDVESSFPKPFCMMEESGKPIIDTFVKEYKIGRPHLEITIRKDRIIDVEVLRSAPCGSSWFTAHEIKDTNLNDLDRTIWRSHRGYPCTASMHIEPESGQPFLNKSGEMILDAVHDAVSRAKISKKIFINKEKLNINLSSCLSVKETVHLSSQKLKI